MLTLLNCATVPVFMAPSCDTRLVADWPVWPTKAKLFIPACPIDAEFVPPNCRTPVALLVPFWTTVALVLPPIMNTPAMLS